MHAVLDSNEGDPARCFVVIAASRTGSTLLAGVLQQHPDVRCHGEILDARETYGYREHDLPVSARRTAPARRAVRLRGSLAFYQRAMFETDHRRVGAKILYQQLFGVVNAQVVAWLTENESIDVVHLTRRDGLARFVSVARHDRVRRTSAAHRRVSGLGGRAGRIVARPIALREKRIAAATIRIDVDEALEDIENQRLSGERAEAMFAGHRVHRLVYEDLVADPDGELGRLADFLGVAPQQMSLPAPPSTRLADQVSNWDELEADPRLVT